MKCYQNIDSKQFFSSTISYQYGGTTFKIMKKNIIFFGLHFSIIFIFSLYLTIKSYKDVNGQRNFEIPIITNFISKLNMSDFFIAYRIITGTNTGYGFYGTSVATQKFILVEVYDKECKLLCKDDNFNFKTLVGKSRFSGFSVQISNFMNETRKIKNEDSSNKKIVALRDKYVEKIFKHLGKSVSNKFKNSKSYKISLITVLPVSIWNKKKIEKNIVYVEKIYWYDVT